MTTRSSTRRAIALAIAGLTVALVTPTASIARAPEQLPAPAVPPRIDPPAWETCFRAEAREARRQTGDSSIRFECAMVPVPLDHDEPEGATIRIAVVRLPARDSADHSLFVNPGGPGGSGVDYVVGAAPYIYADSIRNRFDVVSFDPRGVGRSAVLRCFRRQSALFRLFPSVDHPRTGEELRQWKEGDEALGAACASRDPAILPHMSTANVARDMDLLRQAVGDEQLTYQGFSYGTYLGVTYANLFPDNVRAVVVDAVLDPVAWSGLGNAGNRPLASRLGSGDSANATLGEFFRLCRQAGGRRCALASAPRDRWNAVLAEAKRRPIRYFLEAGDDIIRVSVDDRTIVSIALGVMYNTGGWQNFADYIEFLEQQIAERSGAAGRTAGVAPARFTFPESPTYPGAESFRGVVCAETRSPSRFSAWASYSERSAEPFGPAWAWVDSSCRTWPAMDADRYTGPYTAETSTPLLVASTTFDPATPYAGARAVRRLAPGSRLVTVDGWGHTMFGLSRCGDRVVTNYIVNQVLPSDDVRCTQESNPFPRRTRSDGPTARDIHLDALVASGALG